jgi:hydroxypyruvate reductase
MSTVPLPIGEEAYREGRDDAHDEVHRSRQGARHSTLRAVCAAFAMSARPGEASGGANVSERSMPGSGPRVSDDAAARALLRRMFDAAIAAAQPSLCLPPHLPERPRGRVVVIGAGKASAAMAQAVEQHWDGPLTGLVVTRYGYAVPCARIEIVEAAHPVPDAAGRAAALRIIDLVRGLNGDDLVLCLISGGGSALLAAPAPGLALEDKQAVNRALLGSGATISEMNCVRRHLSAVKGGRLAALCHPARVVNLLISDVPGDDPIDIASGPTVGDPTTCADALAIVARYGIELPSHVHAVLASGAGESVKPGDRRLARVESRFVATPQEALEAAAAVAREAGLAAYILGDAIEGEARDVGKVLAGIARNVARRGEPFAPPCVLLSGGETTVTLHGEGRGGRNVELLLSLAIGLQGEPGVWALAGDTDGVDGIEEIAGAIAAPDTLARAWRAGLRPRERLAANDGHGFFQALGDSVVTGPTFTNVNDFRAVLVTRPAP